MEFDPSELQYYLLPSGNPPLHLIAKHNQIHRFWKDAWLEILRTLNSDPGQLDDDFLRQDFIGAICSANEVISTHLYSFFSLKSDAAQQHRYLRSNYPSEFFTALTKLGVQTVMSMEYLLVNPKWRKKHGLIPLGEVTATLAFEVMRLYGIDCAIAPARRDHKVHEMAYKLGGECILANVTNHNVPCDLIAIRAAKAICPDSNVATLRDSLWKNRIHADIRGMAWGNDKNARLKLAA